MSSPAPQFCSWGMYAFTEPLQSAWRQLFDSLRNDLAESFNIDPTLRFDTDEATLRSTELLVGQTCGYPLIKFYKDDLVPLCVPVFNVEGCDDIYYSSAIIVSADSDIHALEDCRGKTVAINGPDSNSGMNLIRDAVSRISATVPYFSSTVVSGSHLASVRAVAEKRADVAAIDCVTFDLIKSAYPTLVDSIRVIGYTDKTASLPFVIPAAKADTLQGDQVAESLNAALDALAEESRDSLPVIAFKSVSLSDYRSIEDMEESAEKAGRSGLEL